jgi:hypothetical protein
MTKNKKFDCVEMKHRAAQRVQNKLAGKTRSEKINYWNSRYQDMLIKQASMQHRSKKAA